MTVVSLSALIAACSCRDQTTDPKFIAELLVQTTDVANGKNAVIEVDYLVKNLFVRKEVSVIYGPTNCGKSTLISTVGMAVVRGRPFAGFLTRRTAVLHVAPEGARSVQDSTFLHIGAGAPNDAELYLIVPLRIDLRDPHHVITMIELVNALERQHGCDIGLIIVDTLVLSVDDADENASRDMMAAIFGATRLAEGSGAHVTLVHHTNKSGDVRGSSVITCNPDAVFEIAAAKDEQDRPVMRMTWRCCMEAAAGEAPPFPRGFRRS
jgi:RecA-family ATPase